MVRYGWLNALIILSTIWVAIILTATLLAIVGVVGLAASVGENSDDVQINKECPYEQYIGGLCE